MMKETARKLGLRRLFIEVPFFTPTLSRLWVSLITGASRDLVYPLVDSLAHPMVARSENYFSSEWSNRTYFELLDHAVLKVQSGRKLFRFRAQRKTVRSVQRMELPADRDAIQVKDLYLKWLPVFLSPLIQVRTNKNEILFSAFWIPYPLLRLELNRERSDPDRQLLYIVGGLLVSRENSGRLEFRVVLERKFVLAAIHDYRPSLPWFVYKYTQAVLHLFVMTAFARRLRTHRVGK